MSRKHRKQSYVARQVHRLLFRYYDDYGGICFANYSPVWRLKPHWVNQCAPITFGRLPFLYGERLCAVDLVNHTQAVGLVLGACQWLAFPDS